MEDVPTTSHLAQTDGGYEPPAARVVGTVVELTAMPSKSASHADGFAASVPVDFPSS